MQERTTPRAKQAAELALKRAQDECLAAQIDPGLHEEMLTQFVIEEVGLAMAEMAHDKARGRPTAAFTLTQLVREARGRSASVK